MADSEEDRDGTHALLIGDKGESSQEEGFCTSSTSNAMMRGVTRAVHVADIDTFLSELYEYHFESGIAPIIAEGIAQILCYSCVLVLGATLYHYIDWEALYSESKAIHRHDTIQLFVLTPFCLSCSSWRSAPLMISFCGVAVYILVLAIHLLYRIRRLWKAREFYQSHLHLDDQKLHRMSWSEVAAAVVEYQNQARLFRAKFHNFDDINTRIMRLDNFLIALFTDESMREIFVSFPLTGTNVYVLKVVLQPLFDSKFQLNSEFTAIELRNRLRWIGYLQCVLMPGLIGFYIFYFLLRYFRLFYTPAGGSSADMSTLTQYAWTPYAQWRLRYFSELQHTFRKRIHRRKVCNAAEAVLTANDYVHLLYSPLCRFISFVSGSLVLVLVLLLTLGDPVHIELHVVLFGRPPVWWIAVLSAVAAFFASIGQSKTPYMRLDEAENKLMHEIDADDRFTCSSMKGLETLYKKTGAIFADEFWSIVSLPYILLLVLPRAAVPILDYIHASSRFVPGIGDVCSLAYFGSDGVYCESKSLSQKRQRSITSLKQEYPSWQRYQQTDPNIEF